MIKILKYGEIPNSELFSRSDALNDVSATVADILENVKKNGDKALLEYTARFDKVELGSLEVDEAELEEAISKVEPDFIKVLERAASNIRAFHSRQVRNSFILNEQDGVVIGQKIMPIESVGIYVPDGTAPLSSTVLMDTIPAKIAGCREIIMVSSPNADGHINPYIIAAAKVAGVDRIFKVGGAQAIAALAFGTESIPKVDKIVGPGSAYVAEAKKQVYGKVSIDMIAGPSEVLIIADEHSDAREVAADMLSQAEHDKMAQSILVTDSAELAAAVVSELEEQIKTLSRADTARASIEENGKIIITDDFEKAIGIANEIAPEHLELMCEDPFSYLPEIKNAGSVFLGRNCPEPLGDYFAGTNHVLPTSGSAKFSSPLSVDDFVKKSAYIYYTKEALEREAYKVSRFAEAEGLTAHAKSATVRFEK